MAIIFISTKKPSLSHSVISESISAQVNNLEMHNNKWEKVANNFKV